MCGPVVAGARAMKTARALRSVVLTLALASTPAAMLACDEGTSAEQEQAASSARFETFVGEDGQTYFQLLAGNGQRVLRSEGYTSAGAAKTGISSVKTNGVLPKRFKIIEAANGDFYFNVVAKNGEVIATSEMYETKSNATRATETVQKILAKVTQQEAKTGNAKLESFKGQDAKYYFRLRAGNGEIVLQSEGYERAADRDGGIESVKDHGVSLDSFEIVEGQSGQHSFRLVAVNGEVIARGETYVSASNAERGAQTVLHILRDLESETTTDAEVQAEIERAAEGAFLVSETDAPFTFVSAALGSGEGVTEAVIRAKLAKFVDDREDLDGPLADLVSMTQSWEEWKAESVGCTEDAFPGPAECLETRILNAALEANLSDIQVFYFGRDGEPGNVEGVAVTVFIVGVTEDGTLAGVQTLAVWT